MASNTQQKLNIKLLVDRSSNRVVFAEAGKDFIDFLFGLLTLPVGSIIKLTENKEVAGCFGKLYESVEQLSPTYIQLDQNKDSLLKPMTYSTAANVRLLLPTVEATAVDNEGYVKDVVKYIVMDDLVVMPMPTISALDLLELNIAKASSLVEVDVYLGVAEGMELLKATARSKKVLTDVFLQKRSFYDGTGGKVSEQLKRVYLKRFPGKNAGRTRGTCMVKWILLIVFGIFVLGFIGHHK